MPSPTVHQAPSLQWMETQEQSFRAVVSHALNALLPKEALTLSLGAENSQFVRFNNARIRQLGTVTDGTLHLRFCANGRQVEAETPFTGNDNADLPRVLALLSQCRSAALQQPEDPSIVLPSSQATSRSVSLGSLPPQDDIARTLLLRAEGTDMCGLYAGGPMVQALADSSGQFHWFASESFFVDYSLWHSSGKAVKSGYAGTHWHDHAWEASLHEARSQLLALNRPVRRVEPGALRAYLEPAALAEILSLFSWNGLSERSLRQKGSALLALREGRQTLSPLFTLRENFATGTVPRFTSDGDLAPEDTLLINKGTLASSLVSSRTGKEYGIAHNGACSSETLRSPVVDAGTLSRSDALARLDTGLWLPNLHYLNWSDVPNARFTGMTRYACLWVENGKFQGPIGDMRFDDTLYNVLGASLEALTREQHFIPETGTYGSRHLGGILLPGALVGSFRFTL